MSIFPIIVCVLDDRSIEIFNNVEELNNGTIEVEDILERNYSAYDLQGNLLEIKTDRRKKSYKIFIFSFCYYTYHGSNLINVVKNSSYNNQAIKLKSQLLEYFNLYHNLHLDPNTSLDSLIKKLKLK